MSEPEMNLLQERGSVDHEPVLDSDVESQREAAPEVSQEQRESNEGEATEGDLNERAETTAPAAAPAAPAAPTTAPVAKDPVLVDLEEILADDLTDLFLALPDDKKLAFKAKGEETAATIKTMMETGKVKVKKILDLLLDWLGMIPGVNKFFLEQEAKIKADNVLKYAEEQKETVQNQI